MTSLKKVVAALLVLLLGGLLYTMFTQAGPYQGGPNGNGKANVFFALETTPGQSTTTPVPLTSLARKPNTKFTIRPYVDLTGLTGADQTNAQVAAQLAGFVITVGFNPAVLQLVNPNIPNGADTVCTDPTLNPLFVGSTGKFLSQCNSFSFGPLDNQGNLIANTSTGTFSFVIGAAGNKNPTGLIALPAITFVTSSTNNASTTITFLPPVLPNGVKPTSLAASNFPGANPSGGTIGFVPQDVAVTVAAAPPVFTPSPFSFTTTENTSGTQTVNITANSPDGDPVTFGAVNLGTGAGTAGGLGVTFTPGAGNGTAATANATLTIPPLGFNTAGTFTFSVPASTPFASASPTFTLTVGNVNRPPTINVPTPTASVQAGNSTSVPFTTADPDPEDQATLSTSIGTVTGLSFTGQAIPAGNIPAIFSVNPNGAGSDALVVTTTANTLPGIYTVTLVANDHDAVSPQAPGSGPLTASANVTVMVFRLNQPPTFTSAAQGNVTTQENTAPTVLNFAASDPNQAFVGGSATSGLTFTLKVTPQAGAQDATGSFITLADQHNGTASVTITPNFSSAGTYNVQVTATNSNVVGDPAGTKSVTQSFVVTVTNVNRPPSLAQITAQTTPELIPLIVPLVGTDPDGNSTLTFTATVTPTGNTPAPPAGLVTVTNNNAAQDGNGALTVNPPIGTNGTYSVSVRVNDNDPVNPLTATQTFPLTISFNDRAPQVSAITNVTLTAGANGTFQISATDPDLARTDGVARTLSFSLAITPTNTQAQPGSAAFITPQSGSLTISGTTGTATVNVNPGATSAGTYAVTVTVNDNDSTGPAGAQSGPKTGTTQFTITVNNVGPVITAIGNQTLNAGQTPITIPVSATDAAGNNLLGLTVNLTCTPAVPPIANTGGAVRSNRIGNVMLQGGNRPLVGSTTSTSGFASLQDNGNGSGVLTLAPGFTDQGTCQATVTATETGIGANVPGVHSANTKFTVTVNPTNRPPTFASPAPNQVFTVKESFAQLDNSQTFTAVVNNPNTDETLRFVISTNPANLNPAPTFVTIQSSSQQVVNGVLVGTVVIKIAPQVGDAAKFPSTNFILTVNNRADNLNIPATLPFTVNVQPGNRPPVLTTTNLSRTVLVGSTSTVVVTATDPDSGAPLNQNVTLSLQGAPSFVTIGPTTKDANSNFNATITIAPGLANAGVFTPTVVATDNGQPPLNVTTSLTITVQNTPQVSGVTLTCPNNAAPTGGAVCTISFAIQAATGINRLQTSIQLSTDGGVTFPATITNSVAAPANGGNIVSVPFTIPNISTTKAVIRVVTTEPAGTGNGLTLATAQTSMANSATLTFTAVGTPALTLISPTSGSAFIPGSTIGVQVGGTAASAGGFTVSISVDGGLTFTNIGTIPAGATSANIVIPATINGVPVATTAGVIQVSNGTQTFSATGLTFSSAPIITRVKYFLAGGGHPTNELQLTGLNFLNNEMEVSINGGAFQPVATRQVQTPGGISFLLIFSDSNNIVPVGLPATLVVRNNVTGIVSAPFTFVRTVR